MIAICAYLVSAEYELFEEFYEYSREHEDWELDELFTFAVVAALAFPIILFNSNRRLKKTLKQKYKTEKELAERTENLELAMVKATQADLAKSEFLANMSHEIRTPMNGVMGMAELLARTNLDTKQKNFADIIIKSGGALLTIINDILDFSKIGAGQMVLDPAPFNLRDAVESVATLFSAHVSEKNLELAVRIDPRLSDTYVGDVGRVRQVITNLVGNAIKFTDEGYVSIDVSGRMSDGGVCTKLIFTIKDTGMGIPPEQHAKIFEQFSQVDESATRKHEGTGLGLAISNSLVELMGGQIQVESTFGEGATFSFSIELPAHDSAGKGKMVPRNIKGSSVFIIDDNQVNRSILIEQMTNWGFDSHDAESGKKAIIALTELVKNDAKIDAIILDYNMPEMNGAEVVSAIRSDELLQNIPIVMLSSTDIMKGGDILSSMDIQAHLVKPARSLVLLESLVDVLQAAKQAEHLNEELVAAKADKQEITEAQNTSHHSNTIILETEPMLQLDVLLAEDNEVNQLVMTEILEQENFRYKLAPNGAVAVETYKTDRPLIILMDVSMPIMNGLDATKAIRELEAGTDVHTPIIGVTAHALKGDMEMCLDAGMDDYLPKPVSPNMLIEKIQKWVGETQHIAKAG